MNDFFWLLPACTRYILFVFIDFIKTCYKNNPKLKLTLKLIILKYVGLFHLDQLIIQKLRSASKKFLI